MQLKYYKMMTPSWLKNKGKDNGVKFGTEVQWNDVELTIPADTRFNETIFQVPLMPKDVFRPDERFAVRIVAGLEYKDEWSLAGGRKSIVEELAKNTNAIARLAGRLNVIEKVVKDHSAVLARHEQEIADLKKRQAEMQATINALQAQLAWMQRPRVDPMCIMVSGKYRSVGFEIRDPAGYTKYGPYRGVEGAPGTRGLIESTYVPDTAFKDGILAPTKSSRWPQVYRMQIFGDVDGSDNRRSWGAISSDIDGGHSVSFEYNNAIDPSTGLRFTVYRGERNEIYHINYFEVSIYQ